MKNEIASNIPFDDYLKIEQVKALFSSLPVLLIGNFTVSLLTVVFLLDAFKSTHLLIWLGIATLIILLRWWTSRKYNKEQVNAKNTKYWLSLFTFFSFLTGLHWGLIPILFFSTDLPVYVLFITSIYSGYIAVAISSNALYFPTFLAFAIPSTFLFATKNLLQGETIYTSIGIMVLFYFVIIIIFARNVRDLFVNNCQLNYENSQLLNDLTLQKENAEKAVDDKNQFLAAASHDLRQPLHAMGLFIDALRPHVENTSGKQIVEKISQSKHAINGLLHGLLDISRLDADVVENYPQNIALSSMIHPIEEEFQLNAEEKGISLEFHVPSDHIAYIDPVLIERVLRNLIDNAIKYTQQGKVSLLSEEKKSSILISIKDTGIGIPSDQQETIFIEFKQLNNSERDRRKGLGLGLSIVKRLCSLMQVDFQLQSELNQGTTISLRLPKGNPEKTIKPETTGGLLLQDITVVVIDDEQDILDGMQGVLNHWGCQVILALSGDEAITALHQNDITPDLIIADFRLRDHENGIEVIERIREEYNEKIKALLITGDTAPDRLQLTQTANVVVMHKPVEAKDLNTQIQALLTV